MISGVSPQESYDYFVPLIEPEAVRRYISAASLAILQRLVELVKMATIATQKRMNLEMNALQLKSDWHTRQVDIHETHLIP